MKKLMYLFLIISSISVKAQDILTFEEFVKIFNSQSEICQFISANEISSYCILHAEPKYFKPFPYCIVPFMQVKKTEELNALSGRLSLACGDAKRFTQEELKEKTGSEIKALLTPFARCGQSILSKVVEEYGCHAFDHPQIFRILKSEHLLNPGRPFGIPHKLDSGETDTKYY